MATRTFPFSYKTFDVLLCMHPRYVCMLSCLQDVFATTFASNLF
jgi:hypothetical protein